MHVIYDADPVVDHSLTFTGPSLLTVMTDKKLPSFDELPKFHNFSGCAWDVWGRDDELGTVNLLTEDVVKKAAEEIK